MKAFKEGNYPEAIDDFKHVLKMAPSEKITIWYLATSYDYEVVPYLDTPENLKTADLAIARFNQVLTFQAAHLFSLKQIAYLYRVTGRIDQAKEYEQQVIAVVPNEAEGHFFLGVMDWVQANEYASSRLKTDGLIDDGVGNLKKTARACSDLVAHNGSLVDEGIKELTRAIELQPDYSDAMAYLNLMYRRRADLYCGRPGDERLDIETAYDWSKRSVLAKKQNPTGEQTALPAHIPLQ